MFHLDARGLIRDLQQLLSDRYQHHEGGLALIKELVQNADDARARTLVLAWCDATTIADNANPLLGRPGILVVNDAPFETRHERAFTSFSTSSKDADAGQIGRFGIGRKSLFHWSEVLFYLGQGAGGELLGGVLDPGARQQPKGEWLDERCPAWTRWEGVDGVEARELRRRVSLSLPDGEGLRGWFAVWLPARETADQSWIKEYITSLSDLPTSDDAMAQLSVLLPQLTSLRVLRVDRQRKGKAESQGSIEREGEGLGRPTARRAREVRSGSIRWSVRGSTPGHATYVVVDEHRNDEKLQAFKRQRGWPTEPPEDLKPNSPPIAMKAEPHGAVTVVIRRLADGASGRLSIAPTIFLPLSGAIEERRVHAPVDVHVLVHGYLFPDSGRQGLDTSGVKGEWNRALREAITLPQLPTALEHALADMEPANAREIIAAVLASVLWRDDRQYVTARDLLIRGPASSSPWSVPANRAVLLIPEPTIDDLRNSLREAALAIDARWVLAWTDTPGLVRESSRWGRNDVALLEEQLGSRIDTSPMSWLPWLSEWQRENLFTEADNARRALLLRVYRACLRSEKWKSALAHMSWASLATTAKRIGLPILFTDSAAFEVLRRLGETFYGHWDVLLVIDKHQTEVWSGVQLDSDLAVSALEAVAALVGDEAPEPKVSKFIALILSATDLKSLLRHDAVKQLPIVDAWSTRDSKERSLVPLDTLSKLKDRGLTFRQKGTFQPQVPAKALAAALAGSPEVLLVRDEAIADAIEVPALTHTEVANAVEINAVSDDLDGRKRLLEYLFSKQVDTDSTTLVQATRKLIAGNDLPMTTPPPPLRMCQRLPRHVARAIYPESWQIIPEPLEAWINEKLARNWMSALRVEDLEIPRLAEDTQRLLNDGASIGAVYTRLGNSGRASLGALIAGPEHRTLWKRLEVHRTVMGKWTSLVAPNQVYFRDVGLRAPAELVRPITLIQSNRDADYDHALSETLEPFDAVHLIDHALDEQLWRVVADHLPESNTSLSESSLQKLRGSPWLPLAAGGFIAPSKVLWLSDELTRLTAALPVQPKPHVFIHAVALELRQHRAWPRIEPHILAGEDAMAALVSALESIPDGPERLRFRPEGDLVLDHLERYLRNDAAYLWWQTLTREFPVRAKRSPMLAEGRCTADRARELLKLTHDIPEGTKLSRDATNWLTYVLRNLCVDGFVSPNDVAECKLPDVNGNVRHAAALSRGTDALPAGHRVHRDLEDLFAVPTVPEPRDGDGPTTTTFEDWLSPWNNSRTSNSLLGHFVALFAVNPANKIGALFKRLLPNDSPEGVLRSLTLVCKDLPQGGEVLPNGEILSYDGSRARLVRFRFVEIRPNERYEVTSLAGTRFEAVFAPNEDTLLVDPQEIPRTMSLGKRIEVIRLWKLSGDTEPSERHKLLMGSIRQLLRSLLGREPKPAKLEQLLKAQAHEAQKLAVIQNMLIDTLPTHLRMLRVHQRHSELNRRLDGLAQKRHQLESKRADQSVLGLGRQFEELDAARRELRHMVESDWELGAHVLRALRDEMRKFQYGIEQVLFELAQNADDAYSQKRASGNGETECPVEVTVVSVSQLFSISLRHDGRPIGHCYREDDREQGWDRDLLNMLALGFSEKGDADTGRFGLGFKSVYLVTDTPYVRSENLSFEIRAGLLPFAAEARGTGGTEFQLPLRDGVAWETVVGRFARLCGLLHVTSQAIDRVSVETPLGRWDSGATPRVVALDRDEGVELALLDVPSLVGDLEPGQPNVGGRWLFIREHVHENKKASGPRKALGFYVADGRVTPMDKRLPSIWVTVPTREQRQLGFVMSGPFGIDVGRSRLADESESSRIVADDLGRLGRKGLILLDSKVHSNEDRLREIFGPHASVDRVACSFLRTIASSLDLKEREWEQARARDLLGRSLLDQVRLIPDVDSRRCVEKDIDFVLDVELEKQPVRTVMREHFALSGVAISTATNGLLKALGYTRRRRLLSVQDLVVTSVPRGAQVDSTTANRLLQLRDVREELSAGTWEALASHVADLLVVHQDDGTITVRDVLLPDAEYTSDEEARLAAFAPRARLLARGPAEISQCVALFRKTPLVDIETLVTWARSAASEPSREGVVAYLLLGRQRDALRNALQPPPDWLNPDLFRRIGKQLGLRENQVEAAAVQTHGLVAVATHHHTYAGDTPRPAQRLPISAIQEWWADEAERAEAEYQRDVYPAPYNDRRHLGKALKACDRHAWGTLFMLAVCQRIGRTRPEQHREFFGNHELWLRTLAKPDSSAEDWIGLIDEWGEQNWTGEEYSHWLGLFPSLRRIWHHLDDLIALFSSAPPPNQSPRQGLSFASNSQLSGTGLRLPNLTKGFGAKGQIWLHRELVRLEVWAYRPDQHYYVPWRIVGKVLDTADDPMAIAQGLLDGTGSAAPFGRCFDLPFDILRFKKKLQQSLSLGSSDDSWADEEDEYDD